MPATEHADRAELGRRLARALDAGETAALAAYLVERSGLPGPRMNLALTGAFADAVGALVAAPDPPVAQLERLLDGWANLSLTAAPVNDPREIQPAAAVLAYGQVAVARPDWWPDEIAKLRRAAADSRWRTREMVAAALQRMLAADWPRTWAALAGWAADDDPLVVRAAAAGVAEPPLLRDPARGAQAVGIQAAAVARFTALPPARRSDEAARILRQALGYTLSVAVAAAPAAGFPLLDDLADRPDPDLRWILRENLKKNRLHPWAERVAALRARLP